MKQKLISIIVPTHNCGSKLAPTIESVLSQDGDLFELIVVDGGSTDDTEKVLDSYKGVFKFISEPDRSVYDAMNKGIRMSSGKYLLFLGAGDHLRSGVLRQMAGILPEAGLYFVYGNTFLMKEGVSLGGEFSKKELACRNICHQAIFYDRAIFRLLGEYDLKYKICADWVFNIKCFAKRRIRKLYCDVIVTDFEGGGLSETELDPEFVADRSALIRRYVEGYLSIEAFNYFKYRLKTSVRAFAMLPVSFLKRKKPRTQEQPGGPPTV